MLVHTQEKKSYNWLSDPAPGPLTLHAALAEPQGLQVRTLNTPLPSPARPNSLVHLQQGGNAIYSPVRNWPLCRLIFMFVLL